MERTATTDTEYVDIVLGYHHVVLFSLVFGALVFGGGYYIGYYRAQSHPVGPAASRSSAVSTPGAPGSSLPAVQVPAMLTQPATPQTGDVVQEMEQLSTGSLTPAAKSGEESEAARAAESAVTAVPQRSQPAEAAAVPAPQQTPARTPQAAPEPAAETPSRAPQSTPNPVPRAASGPPNASGNVYLQVSSFGEPNEAEALIDDLAAEGFRALVDGQLIEGKHTVLVGPFSNFKSAAEKLQELKQRNRVAFPIRR